MSVKRHLTADVIIVGAGLAGLMAARTIQAAGISATVLDKGRSVGGRLATRRIGSGLADHGAQFFTVRSDVFKKQVDEWIDQNLVFEWSRGFSDGSLMEVSFDGHKRYATYGGMNAITKQLAQDIEDIRTDVKVVTVTGDNDGWVLQDEDGHIFACHSLIMTPPVPQSLALLDEGATVLRDDDYTALARITYAECLTAMFWVEGRVTLPAPGAVQRRNHNIAWIGDNKQKGISPGATVITMQAGEQYSRQMWNAPDDRVLSSFKTNLQVYMDERAIIREAQLKRWRYSRPLVTYPDPYLQAKFDVPILFSGDAFGGPRVEGAYLSGIAAGEKIVELLSN
jgi:renalase